MSTFTQADNAALQAQLKSIENQINSGDAKPEESTKVTYSKHPFPERDFKVHIKSAEVLKSTDSNGLSDPFVRVSCGKDKLCQTPVIKKTLSPKWDFHADVKFRPANQPEIKNLVIELYDKDTLGSDFVGKAEVHFTLNSVLEDPLPLVGKDGTVTAKVSMSITMV